MKRTAAILTALSIATIPLAAGCASSKGHAPAVCRTGGGVYHNTVSHTISGTGSASCTGDISGLKYEVVLQSCQSWVSFGSWQICGSWKQIATSGVQKITAPIMVLDPAQAVCLPNRGGRHLGYHPYRVGITIFPVDNNHYNFYDARIPYDCG